MKKLGTGDHHVVCLHGWFGSADGWGYWPEVANADDYTWHFPEVRGYGARGEETGEHSMREYAADALAELDAAGVERFSILGHSMGGKAAASLLSQAGGRVRALIGISPVGPGPVPLDADGHGLFYGAPNDPALRRAIIDFTTGNRNSGVWLDRMVAFSEATSTVDAFTGALRSWVEDDYTADLGEARAPIRCIVGSHDPALSADTMRATWMATYDDVDLVEIADAGHYAMFETPVWLATTIEEFLAER